MTLREAATAARVLWHLRRHRRELRAAIAALAAAQDAGSSSGGVESTSAPSASRRTAA